MFRKIQYMLVMSFKNQIYVLFCGNERPSTEFANHIRNTM